MADRDSISKLLDALQAGDASAAAAVYLRFEARAREVAKGRISPRIRAGVGISDIVQEALKSALSFVREGGLRQNRREDFEAILVTLIRRKAASAARKAAMEEHLAAEAAALFVDTRPLPDEEAMRRESAALAREVVWEMTQFLFQQPEALKSKHLAVRGLVRVLGVIHGLDAPEIRNLLGELFPDTQPPAKRTIQLAVQDGWEMLKKEFGNGRNSGGISS